MSETDLPLAELPALSAPVSRRLPVADVRRSVAFYRDVLGFELRSTARDGGRAGAVQLVRGPVAIEVVAGEAVTAAVVFLQTVDVAALHAAVRARGGRPGQPQRVNWINYEVFEVRDPDGHTLGFGQSFHQAGLRRPKGLLEDALPELPCADVAAGVRHYVQALGFSINYEQEGLGVMQREEVTLLLLPRSADRPGPGGAEFYVRDADALHAELVGRGARVQGEPVSHPWGLRDFLVLDLDGNRLTFAQPFE